MPSMSADGASVVAHGIHYAILGVGVVGLTALLAPRFLGEPAAPRDHHEARVRSLRSAVATGSLVTGTPVTRSLDTRTAAAAGPSTPALARSQVLLPLAVVASASAAGVHAAFAAAHLREPTLFGFFAVAAGLQLLWAAAMAAGSSRRRLALGVLGNVVLLGLWALTRTAGLPFGLMPAPEPVGAWDLACGLWELVVVASGVVLLRSERPLPARLAPWRHWGRTARGFVVVSALLLGALSLSGAGA